MSTATKLAVLSLLLVATRAAAQSEPTAADLIKTTPGQKTQVKPDTAPELQIQLNHADGNYSDGDLLRVRVRTLRSAHLYMLYHQADGTAVLVFPNIDRKNSRFAGNQTHELPSRNDEVQCVIRGPFERELVQVVASPVAIASFEDALKQADGSVPTMKSTTVDAICSEHAEKKGLVSEVAVVTAK
ncbi:MAG: DUF4384 domain-containing protein [Planctomycetota bacterium]